MVRTINMHMDLQIVVVGNIFRLETCMNSLVKVPSYSKLNFQGKIFFTQNWCNITLSYQVIDTWQTHADLLFITELKAEFVVPCFNKIHADQV
jgi:hypothetical protein